MGIIPAAGDTDARPKIPAPADWRDGIGDWPLSQARLDRAASDLARVVEDRDSAAMARPHHPALLWPAMLLRNLVVMLILVAHLVRRIAPL